MQFHNPINKKINVLFIFGGISPEHEVSCRSAAGLIKGTDTEKYTIHKIGITKTGKWIYTEASSDEIEDSMKWLNHSGNRPVTFSLNRDEKKIIVFDDDKLREIPVDIIFPVIHGENGEDGTLQGLFKTIGIPYVGSGIFASSCSIDKTLTMEYLKNKNILIPRMFHIEKEKFTENPESILKDVENFHVKKYPLVVKPSMTGSSIGVAVVNNREELLNAMMEASKYKGEIIVEEYIKGHEIKVAILDAKPIIVGDLCETIIENGILNDYQMKYHSTVSHHIIPADIDEKTRRNCIETAVLIFNLLQCKGLARVDFFLAGDKLYFNEINTMPGISKKSIYPRMLDSIGIGYSKLIDTLIVEELKRH